jgi:hypothetical protein
MERSNSKKNVNKKVEMVSKLKLNKTRNTEQDSIDNLVENFSQDEKTFDNLKQAQEFIKNRGISRMFTGKTFKKKKTPPGEPEIMEEHQGIGLLHIIAVILVGLVIYTYLPRLLD